MKIKSLFIIVLVFILLTSACSKPSSKTDSDTAATDDAANIDVSELTDTSSLFSDRDYEVGYDKSESIYINLNGSSADCDSDAVTISGSTVSIATEGTYVLSGSLDDGMIIVNTDKTEKIQLVLDNADINSETSAPIYILQADKVFVTLAADSSNTLSNGGTFTAIDNNNIDAVIFSKEDVTLNGAGSLTITSPAGHGVVSKDELTVTSGTYLITSAAHGLSGKDNVCIANAVFDITSGKDGIHSENADDAELGFVYIKNGTFNISSEGDGISAAAYMQIDDGTFEIISGGGSVNASQQTSDAWGGFMGMFAQESMTSDDSSTSIKGIKASSLLQINGGTFTIDSADDSVHSNSSLTVNGGTFAIASGDDAFHSDEALTINSGTIEISESYEGLEGLSIDICGGDITLTASDDGLNAAGGNDQSGFGGFRGGDIFASDPNSYINISGGTLHINAYGDGIDSNGSLNVTGGHTLLSGPTDSANSALDYASQAVISGGTFIASGSSQMAANFSATEKQGVIMISTGSQTAGSSIELTDAGGSILLSCTAEKEFSSLILSCPEIVEGESYALTVGSDTFEITMTDLLYTSSAGGGFGNMGDMGGDRGGMGDMGGRGDMGNMTPPDMGDMGGRGDMGNMTPPGNGNIPPQGGSIPNNAI